MFKLQILNLFQFTLLATSTLFSSSAFSQSRIVDSKPETTQQNTNVIPKIDTAISFARSYDQAHLTKNKEQFITLFEISISRYALGNEKEEISFTIASEIRDIKNEKTLDGVWENSGRCAIMDWTNQTLSCESAHGSVFLLKTRKEHVTLEIPKNKSLALVDWDSDRRLVLDGNDENNRSFWLYPTEHDKTKYLGQDQ